MLDSRKVKHKPFRRYLETGSGKGLKAEWLERLDRIASMLNAAVSPRELDVPGLRFHELKGDRSGTYSIRLTGNWRVTFRFDESGPFDVDIEDYHGR